MRMRDDRQKFEEMLNEIFKPTYGRIILTIFLVIITFFVVVVSGASNIDNESIPMYFEIPIWILLGPVFLFESITNTLVADMCFFELLIFLTWLYSLSSIFVFIPSKFIGKGSSGKDNIPSTCR